MTTRVSAKLLILDAIRSVEQDTADPPRRLYLWPTHYRALVKEANDELTIAEPGGPMTFAGLPIFTDVVPPSGFIGVETARPDGRGARIWTVPALVQTPEGPVIASFAEGPTVAEEH